MQLDLKKIARVVIEQTTDKPDEEIKIVIEATLELLRENGQIGRWRELEQAIHQVWKEQFGASQVTITSAHALNADAAQRLQKIARGADIHQQIDESLIGGAVLRVDDKRIDGSVAGALKQLKFSLSN